MVLPGMAAGQAWPIRLDHCFMRVFLDHAMGARWDTVVERPAVRHMPTEALRRAVDAAEAVLADPALLPGFDSASLAYRRTAGRAGAGPRRTGVTRAGGVTRGGV